MAIDSIVQRWDVEFDDATCTMFVLLEDAVEVIVKVSHGSREWASRSSLENRPCFIGFGTVVS